MDGLKARLSFDAVAYDYDDEYLTIDTDTHTININNVSRLFGVQYDGNSKLIKFRIRNKLSDIQKMQDSIVYINWIDSRGVKGQSIAINKSINNDTCEFAWKVPFDALKNSGVLHFAMSAVVTKNSSSVIDQRWSTQIASVITPDGIYIKSYTPSSEEEDRIAQIYTELSNMINKQNDNLQSQVNSLKEDLGNLKKAAKTINALSMGMISGDYSARMTNYNIMNQMISSFGDDGGVIYLPKGTYYLAGFIQWKSKVCLYGDGMGQTIVKPTFNMAFKGDHLTDFEMHGFTIDGDENSDPNAGKGIYFSYLHNVTFRDIEIKNTKESGFGCDYFQNGVLDNIRCDNCGTKGNLETGVAYGCSGLGIGVGCWKHGKEGLTITNCHVNNCIQNGAFFERQTPTGNYGDFPVGISVIGCTAEGNRNGFGVSGCDSITFIGCTAYKNHHAGFSYDNGTMNGSEQYGMRPKFIGCIAKENGKSIPDGYPEYNSESNGHGFVVTNNYRGIEMISCNALDNLKNGLFIANGVQELSVIGGTFDENGECGIRFDGNVDRFKLHPSFVQNNKQKGIYITGVASHGSIKNAVVTGNTHGIYSVNNLNDVFVRDNASYENNRDEEIYNRSLDFNTGIVPLSIPKGTKIKVAITVNSLETKTNITFVLRNNGVIFNRLFDALDITNKTTVRETILEQDMDDFKIASSGSYSTIVITKKVSNSNFENVNQLN